MGQALAAAGEGVEEGGGMRAGVAEAIPAAQLLGPPLGRGEPGQMGLGLDPLAAVVGAGMARDFRRAVQDAPWCSEATSVSGRRISVWGME